MTSHEWLSPRFVTIVGILIVLLAIFFHFYMQQDVQQFEASLPKVPTTQPVQASFSSSGSFQTEEAITEPTAVPISKEDTTSVLNVEKSENIDTQQAMISGSDGACSMCDMSHMKASGDPKRYAGLTDEEYSQAVAELNTFQSSHADELLDKIEAYLIAKWGPDPRIPEMINLTRTGHKLWVMSQNMRATGYNSSDVDSYLNQLPTVVRSNMIEIAIDLFNPPEEEVTLVRESLARAIGKVDRLKLLQETRPMIQRSIDAGELSPQEGEAFIKSVTGLRVTMLGEDSTSTVGDSITPKTPAPESVDLNVVEFPSD